MVIELTAEKVYKVCGLDDFGFDSTQELTALETIVGQDRAIRAMQFGLGIKEKGFNIYVSGMPGTGRTTAVRRYLEEVAVTKPMPNDWCYVNNFRDPYQPNALTLPAGRAVELQKGMENLTKVVFQEVRNVFESEEYAKQKEETLNTFQQRKQEILDNVNQMAIESGFMLQPTPMGVVTVPTRNGKPLSEQDFLKLSQKEKDALLQNQQKVQNALEASIRQAKNLEKDARDALDKVDREVALYTLRNWNEDMKAKFQDLAEVLAYIQDVQVDLLDQVELFKTDGQEEVPAVPFATPPKSLPVKKYAVNILVDNSRLQGAPVIVETNPTHGNLFGRIEQEARFGALVTDFTLVRGGALHRANGGYLVLPVEDVLRNPFAWEGLSHALANAKIDVEDATEKFGFSTRSLKPEPIPLDIKVILIGRPDIFQLLLGYEVHFHELFKVKAEFDTVMSRDSEHTREYAGFATMLCNTENLKHLDRSGLTRLVEHGSRLAEDQEKLSTRFGEISDVIREASYYAGLEGVELITAQHIRKAIEERYYRSNLVQERLREMIARGVIKIDIQGTKVGQINGLSVLGLGDISFGQPNRITVSLSLGREGVVNIEREAKLSGPIHTKGVLILAGFLANRYAQDKPLSLSARLVFEQSYGGIEGDSASSTELYALLSALTDLPVKQAIAVTGSVNQNGEVQAIGGVNEKVEGYFEICQAVGMTGVQGVIIPESNVANLMLKETVVEAIQQGKFHLWPVRTIDEGIEVLTGVKAGERLPDGSFESESVNACVDERLRKMAEVLQRFGKEDGPKPDKSDL
ncbi:MAG: ATP-dependent protease [Chloroflexi bacterium RBG_13_50_21]|nr:MAG: ATP-dependent protease [Chloroflexi bacterium RBG_13_50_21]